mmetsp:Transcript_24346/g.65834  ORF Transcript_24346/g.65834 Transcript_24346/m.65834 type:complete len:178 (-) Transcript_24346:247-780(-)
MSRWLVGSSSSKSSGWMNRARARATRMRQPPEKSLVIMCCFFSEKPRPVRMPVARARAVDASICSSFSYKMLRRSMISICSSSSGPSASSAAPPSSASPSSPPPAPAIMRSFSPSISFSIASRSASTDMTASIAVISVAGYSVVRWNMLMVSGIGMARAPITRITVVLPDPLRPMKP